MGTTTEVKIGSRVIRSGQVVKITGERGLFTVQGFDTDAGTVDVYGGTPGPKGRRMFRTFYTSRIGARPVEANRRARASA